jgi:hypothetical protein
MEELEVWMQHSGRSLLSASPGPWPPASSLPVTVVGDTWYVHVPPSHAGRVELRVHGVPRSVALARTRDSVEWALKRVDCGEVGQGKLVFEVPEALRTALDDVVAVRF